MQEANADRKGATARARLDMFVGKWRTTGQSFAEGQRIDDPRASAVPWTSEESYEWLPGGHFLLHRWDATVGTYPFKGTEIIGFDESRGGYFSHLFDMPATTASIGVNVRMVSGSSVRQPRARRSK